MIEIVGASKEEKALLKSVWETGLSVMGAERSVADLSIVGRDRIRALNKETRGVDRVTDVLSFPTLENVSRPLRPADYPLDVEPETGYVNLGSVVICRAKAKEQAAAYGHSYQRELSYLSVHGLLHLLSFDHIEEADRARMREEEERILEALGIRR